MQIRTRIVDWNSVPVTVFGTDNKSFNGLIYHARTVEQHAMHVPRAIAQPVDGARVGQHRACAIAERIVFVPRNCQVVQAEIGTDALLFSHEVARLVVMQSHTAFPGLSRLEASARIVMEMLGDLAHPRVFCALHRAFCQASERITHVLRLDVALARTDELARPVPCVMRRAAVEIRLRDKLAERVVTELRLEEPRAAFAALRSY
jgi:hypothetical protein